jgi:hypothetical protein
MSLVAHSAWARQFLKAESPAKKTFRVLDAKSPKQAVNVDINLMQDKAPADGTTAEYSGWVVTVTYTNAPDVVLFTQTYLDESTARKVMDDIGMVAAEVEGFLKKEDFEGAQKATKAFTDKLAANSGSQPVTPTEK